jgi:peptidoglycan/xylan/chitin deacetylase (PgdA/CDA1 family)
MTKVGLIFDDGFAKSCLKTADVFEARGLRATYAVLVNHDGFMPKFPKGDFALWNELQARGHVIHPHGYDHTDLTAISHQHAVEKIDACLKYFAGHLEGFDPAQSIYHATYNRSTPELDACLLTRVRAVRTTGREGRVGSGMNGRVDLARRLLTCAWHGPGYCDFHLQDTLGEAESKQPELLLYMLHGLDEEGWGPIRTAGLERALDYILASPRLQYTSLKELPAS